MRKRRTPVDRRFKFKIGHKVMWGEMPCEVFYREITDQGEPHYKLFSKGKPLFSLVPESKLTAQ